MRSRFLFITLVEHGCSVSDKFYRLWYNVVIACFARFPRFLFLINRQIQKIRNRKNLAKYVITTLYQKCCSQPELWTEIVNACPVIERLTRPLLPSGVPNGEDNKLCAADGWIDEGWEHVTGTLSKLSG